MLTFFRRIRLLLLGQASTDTGHKSLLDSDQARKPDSPLGRYILYATGEIVLVVLGILIALQVNNWNSRSIEKSEEQNILHNLNDDFQKNLKDINRVFDQNKKALESCIFTIQLVGLEKEQLENYHIDSLLLASLDYAHISPSSNALTDLIGSGRLSKLQNLRIKNELYNWSTQLNSVEIEYEGWQQNVNDRMLPFLMTRYPFRDIGQSYESVVNYPSKGSALKVNKMQIFNEIEFENLLDDLIFRMSNYLNQLNVLRKTAQSIITETSNI